MRPLTPSVPEANGPTRLRRRLAGTRFCQNRQAGFTMVEIAICIAVVAFALVAIIGVMPTGLQVQRQNREDTIIAQEGKLWLEAIRSGSLGLDYLTNYVEQISVNTVRKTPDRQDYVPTTNTYRYFGFAGGNGFRDGRDIIGLLSLPGYYELWHSPSNYVFWATNTTAYVRALTGSAAEKAGTNEFAFMYRLKPEVRQFALLTGMNTDVDQPGLSDANRQARRDAVLRGSALRMNLYELRLTVEWPVYRKANRLEVGGNRKTFRTLVSGSLAMVTNVTHLNERDLFFLQPSEFVLP